MKLSSEEMEKICGFYEQHPDDDTAFTDALNMAYQAGAKAEREACAKLCEEKAQPYEHRSGDAAIWAYNHFKECAYAIRSRGDI